MMRGVQQMRWRKIGQDSQFVHAKTDLIIHTESPAVECFLMTFKGCELTGHSSNKSTSTCMSCLYSSQLWVKMSLANSTQCAKAAVGARCTGCPISVIFPLRAVLACGLVPDHTEMHSNSLSFILWHSLGAKRTSLLITKCDIEQNKMRERWRPRFRRLQITRAF